MGIKRVEVKIIPHEKQRYPTVGDWLVNKDTLFIVVSDMKRDSYHHLVAVHEYTEAILCLQAGIDEQAVTDFDVTFELWREEGKVGEFDEPGNDPRAPYFKQHQAATEVEKCLAKALGVDWNAYDLAVNSL
jgi:ASC-1-like (ASCH) protein